MIRARTPAPEPRLKPEQLRVLEAADRAAQLLYAEGRLRQALDVRAIMREFHALALRRAKQEARQ